MERLVAGMRWVDSAHVFTSTIGTPLHAATVTRAFHAALLRAGLAGRPPLRRLRIGQPTQIAGFGRLPLDRGGARASHRRLR